MSESIYVGVDIGGTAIKICVCDSEGRILNQMENRTELEHGYESVLEEVSQYIHQVVANSGSEWEQVASIGIGVPGFTDIEQGLVKFAPNLHWVDVPVRAIMAEKLNKPIIIENDANTAAYGEVWNGASKGLSHVVCFTLGTGVGGGIIIDGQLYRGFKGMAGELGHVKVVPDLEAVQCGCEMIGCLETVSSASGIVRMAQQAVERGDRTELSLLENITAKDVCDAAKAQDDVALRIVQRAGHYLGKAMATVAVMLNPQRFIVGGGVSQAGDILLDPARETFHKYTPLHTREGVDIVTASLGMNAGMIGAAGLAMKAFQGEQK